MPHFPITPMTLDHIKNIEASGHHITDVALSKMLPAVYRITLKIDDGSSRDFYHESAEGGEDITRFRDEVCSHTRAYGARALLQSIHCEVLQRAKSQKKPRGEFVVSLSRDCFSAMEPFLPGYRGYDYTFRVATEKDGMWYSISVVSEQSTRDS